MPAVSERGGLWAARKAHGPGLWGWKSTDCSERAVSCWAAQPGVPLGYVGSVHATGGVDLWCDGGTYSPEQDPRQLPLVVSVAAPYLWGPRIPQKSPNCGFSRRSGNGIPESVGSWTGLVRRPCGLSQGRVSLQKGCSCRECGDGWVWALHILLHMVSTCPENSLHLIIFN